MQICLDPLFIEAVEGNTLKVWSIACSHPIPVGAFLEWGILNVQAGPCIVANEVTIVVAGIRKGCADMRFAPRSPEQMERNTSRWQHLSGV